MKTIFYFLTLSLLFIGCSKNSKVNNENISPVSPVSPVSKSLPHKIEIEYFIYSQGNSPYIYNWSFHVYDSTLQNAANDTLKCNSPYTFIALPGHHYSIYTHTCQMMGPSGFSFSAIDITTNDTLTAFGVDPCISFEGYEGDWNEAVYIK